MWTNYIHCPRNAGHLIIREGGAGAGVGQGAGFGVDVAGDAVPGRFAVVEVRNTNPPPR